MAIKLIANYAKRLGLPGYSSHQFSVSVETELTNVDDVAGESARLYTSLQEAVDEQIQQTGFVPPDGYGMAPETARNGTSGNQRNPPHHSRANGNGSSGENGSGNGNNVRPTGHPNGRGLDRWCCTEGQRGFILRLVSENNLNKDDVEALAQQLFGLGVTRLDKMQASQLIEELLEKSGKQSGRRPSFRREEVRP